MLSNAVEHSHPSNRYAQQCIRACDKAWSEAAGLGSSVAYASDWYSGSRRFNPPVRQHSCLEIGHDIISAAILSLLLIQVGQLSFTDERMCTKYWLTA